MTEILKMRANFGRSKNARRSKEGVWTVPMEEVYPDIRRHVTPTSRDIILCADGDGYFFKGKDDRQNFKLQPENSALERVEYNKMQLRSGNALTDIIFGVGYRVDRTQQLVLDEVSEIRSELLKLMEQQQERLRQLTEERNELQAHLNDKDKMLAYLLGVNASKDKLISQFMQNK